MRSRMTRADRGDIVNSISASPSATPAQLPSPYHNDHVIRSWLRYLFDDIAALDGALPEVEQVSIPPATPRQPLQPRNVNVLAIPPPLQNRKDVEALDIFFEPSVK
jgi:hypothetical protein